MPRIRTIKPDFWEDEKLGRLSDLARLNFVGLISLADDAGRGRGATEWLCNRLHAYSLNAHGESMESSLRELEDSGVVIFYEVHGQRFYQLSNFLKHQKINRPSPSHLPPPPPLTDGSPNPHGAFTAGMDQGMEKEKEGNGSGKGRGGGEGAPGSPLGATGLAAMEELKKARRSQLGITEADVEKGRKLPILKRMP